MARLSYLVNFDKIVPASGATPASTKKYRTTYSCIARVAKFLGIGELAYTPDVQDVVDRAEYVKEYTKADGTQGTVVVGASKVVYLPYGKANAKKVFLKTGAKTQQNTFKKIHFTFPSFLTVGQIADALGELLPAASVAVAGTPPTATQVEPFFTIQGGRKYPLPASTKAELTTSPNLAKSEAEQTVILSESVGRKRKLTIVP